MADGRVLYDALGREVPIGDNGTGQLLVQQAAPVPPAQPGQPVVTPAPRVETPPAQVTTQGVQHGVEYANGTAEVLGGDTSVPFGPALDLKQDPGTQEIEDPGHPWDWFDGIPRRTFRIAPSIGLMPLLRFAHSAKAGLDTDDLEGMAALYDMISDCVHPDDWDAFQAYATVIKAEDEELMEFVSAAMEIIAARPRKRRGSSSATSQSTSPRSRAGSSSPGSPIPPGAIRPAEVDGLMPVSGLVT